MQETSWVLHSAFNTLPPMCHRDSVASGNNDFVGEYGQVLGGAAPTSFCVRCSSFQLQSGLLIKPHETNKAHYWDPQPQLGFALAPCTACRVGRSLEQKTGKCRCTCTASTSYTPWAFDVVWLAAPSRAGLTRCNRKTHTTFRSL